MNTPDNLKYSDDHEWISIEGNVATIGITDYAQGKLGDIVFVELPSDGDVLNKGDVYGVVESVKSVSDCHMPLSGKILQTNTSLGDTPEQINQDCYNEGWMVKIELDDAGKSEIATLMSNTNYEKFVAEESA
ncbi:MAG: glycine cleavage system protein GcvH [Pseudomonadota bacterium]